MNTLLNIGNALLQYHRGVKNGLAGLMGIIVALVVVWQWDNLVPVFQALGIVDFFDSLGLIHSEDYMTGFFIFMFIFKLCILFCAALLVLTVIGFILAILCSNEKIALYVILPILFIIMLPFLLLHLYLIHYPRLLLSPKYRERIKKEQERAKAEQIYQDTALESLLEEHSEELTREEAFNRLNRLPTLGDNLFLLGKGKDNGLYVLIPRPLNIWTGDLEQGELLTAKYSVERYEEKKHKPSSMFEYVPKDFHITKQETGLVKKTFDDMVAFYDTKCHDMRRKFEDLVLYDEFKTYVKNTQFEYFHYKNLILDRIKNADDKETFDKNVKHISKYNASNEEIVKMMLDNENTVSPL